MSDPASDEAYQWVPPTDSSIVDAFTPSDWQEVGWIDAEAPPSPLFTLPEGYRPATSYEQAVGYVHFAQRFICGIDPDDIDPEEIRRVNVIWQIPQPMTITTRADINPEVLEIAFGRPIIALCDRQIPAEGTE